MSWQVTVQYDPDQADVGSVYATWTDPNTALGVFNFTMRIKANAAGLNAFKAAAIAARDNWQVKQAANLAAATTVLNALVAADPKA